MGIFEWTEDDKQIAQMQKEEEQNGILERENVIGVGVGRKIKGAIETDEPCLTVLVSQKIPEDELFDNQKIAPQCGSFPTDVVEVGHLFAGGSVAWAPVLREKNGAPAGADAMTPSPTTDDMSEEWVNTPNPQPSGETQIDASPELLRGRVRPAQGGYSVGHYRVTAGTIATAVLDARTPYPGVPQKFYLLSNNHVLANSNAARIGDPILQPGPHDGGNPRRDVIGRLARFVPITFGGAANYVDAAIADVPFQNLNREIYWIGTPRRQLAGARVNQILQKTGRTTNYSTGKVRVVNATVNVNYGSGRVARFVRQIVTTAMSAGGDSGSLVLDLEDRPVGLLFAGSSTATIINPIQYVQRLLGVRIGF